jgi:hypothetical protein
MWKNPFQMLTKPAPLAAVLFVGASLLPEFGHSADMTFSHGGVAQPCRDPDTCLAWINAKGEITDKTTADFLAYLKNHPYEPLIVRFDSPGGSLSGGIQLGETIRKLGYSTQATFCASACTYAFIGGVERSLVGDGAKIGVHRFYQNAAIFEPSTKQFTGEDLDATQKIMAGLMLYGVEMGVDLRLIAMTAEAGPGEMRWVSKQEAVDLKLTYQPNKWLPWRVEGDADKEAFVAVSETQDGSKSMQFTCGGGNAYFSLLDDRQDVTWFRQCAAVPGTGHPVLGLRVPNSNVKVEPWHGQGGFIGFMLPQGKLDFNNPSLFSTSATYSMACLDLEGDYAGTTDKFKTMATLVLSSCNR